MNKINFFLQPHSTTIKATNKIQQKTFNVQFSIESDSRYISRAHPYFIKILYYSVTCVHMSIPMDDEGSFNRSLPSSSENRLQEHFTVKRSVEIVKHFSFLIAIFAIYKKYVFCFRKTFKIHYIDYMFGLSPSFFSLLVQCTFYFFLAVCLLFSFLISC